MEHPEYLICPVCKEKIKLNYNIEEKNEPIKTEDISVMSIQFPRLFKPGEKHRKLYMRTHEWVHFCNHCNGIIGIFSP